MSDLEVVWHGASWRDDKPVIQSSLEPGIYAHLPNERIGRPKLSPGQKASAAKRRADYLKAWYQAHPTYQRDIQRAYRARRRRQQLGSGE